MPGADRKSGISSSRCISVKRVIDTFARMDGGGPDHARKVENERNCDPFSDECNM